MLKYPPEPSRESLESPFLDREAVLPSQANTSANGEATVFENIVAPAARQTDEVPARRHLMVVDAQDKPIGNAEYAFYQEGKAPQKGTLSASGAAFFGAIDPERPLTFEIRDRVCTIRQGAFLDPDDPKIQYGGTSFDWTLVRDDKNPDKTFWPFYQREMDFARDLEAYEGSRGRKVDRFQQHEHITRRPIRIAKPYLSRLSQVRIRATPVELRTGPFVRYTDHERAVIWLETVSPSMVRVGYRRAGDPKVMTRHASTIRVGGRHFGIVEIDALKTETIYQYTFELAPLPAGGPVPTTETEFKRLFPARLTEPVAARMREQLLLASLDGNPRLSFRTLRPRYETELRFATGSCRWYPGDTNHGKDWGPDMFEGLGDWLLGNPRDKWPTFLFFGGDQIYSDEIGDDTGDMLVRGRFASRVPGPVDSVASGARDKLIDGAWAGRFAHRYQAYRDPPTDMVLTVRRALEQIDKLHRLYPEIKDISLHYPDRDRRRTLRGQKRAGELLGALDKIEAIEASSEPFRAHMPHWKAGFDVGLRRNPMAHRFLSHNFLLWKLPVFERDLPTVGVRGSYLTVTSAERNIGYPAPSRDGHAADFAEYAYLYERAWTTSRSVRRLLAHIPTFLMFDDHEVTDDWNFSVSWVRMLHNPKDSLRMWPKTLTDALAAYWVYQGYCNKAPSKWDQKDPRVEVMNEAQRLGIDALPRLRRVIYQACFTPPSPDEKAKFQAGLTLDWHYKLPFEPAFLVPDCRTRRLMVPSDEKVRIINHGDRASAPLSQTIDGPDAKRPEHEDQLTWIKKHLLVPADKPGTAPLVFLAPSTPLLLQKKAIEIMVAPELAAKAGLEIGDITSIGVLFGNTVIATGSDEQLLLFRRGSDLEHMVRDKSWTDLWNIFQAMHDKPGNRIKTVVMISGDVHHNYAMTANLPGQGRPKPEVLQVTSSGVQTTIRRSKSRSLAEELGSSSFKIGKYRLVPGFMSKNKTGEPDLVLFQNAVALVNARFDGEVRVQVDYVSRTSREANFDAHVYRYTSGPEYMSGNEPRFSPRTKPPSDVRTDLRDMALGPRELEAGI